MSAAMMQAAVVLLHWHPSWRARLIDGEMAGLPLSVEQRRHLGAVDPRAFRADPDRVARMVTSLTAEFPVSIAMVGVPTLFALFTAPEVVGAVLPGGSLIDVAAQWLQGHGAVTATLECAIARARRHTVRPKTERVQVQVASGTVALMVPMGTLSVYADARARMGHDPVAAVAAGLRVAVPLVQDVVQEMVQDTMEGALITTRTGEPQVARCSYSLVEMLHFSATEQSLDAAIAKAVELGADSNEEALELLRDLEAEGVLGGMWSPELSPK